VFVPPDRATLRLLGRARLLLQQQRYAEAVRCLGEILESPEDYFYRPDQGGPVHQSLKSEAQRVLGTMPRAAGELYELQYGARARQMLTEAVKKGDASALTDVSRRFFHTKAGNEATLLLGMDHMDHGRWLAGALTLQRLRDTSALADQFEPTLSLAIATCWLRSGAADRAQEALVELKTRHSGTRITVAGKEVALFGRPVEAVDWLARYVGEQGAVAGRNADDWAMFRGNAARNAVGSASGPLLSLRWRVPTTDHPYIEAMIKQLQELDHQRDEWTVPGLHPLVIDNMVLMRTAQTLLAVDFNTGKRIWEVPVDDPFERLLNPPPSSPFQRGPQLEQGLRYRMWGDATYGTLSSDGKLVFAIEDLDLEIGPAVIHGMFFRGRRDEDEDQGPKPYNRLAAYDIRTGKLKWHVGGSPEEFGLPQAGSFFLGPPLPLMDQLFVIAEVKGEIRLLALEAKSGELAWSQQLADVDRGILNEPLRRLSGVSPSYADGVLVCPTSNKSVVALELASRSLLWGYTYAPETSTDPQMMFFAMQGMVDPSPAGRWTDSSVVIAGDRVLVTPNESNEVHCLSLLQGKLLWKQPRQDDLYLACVYRDKAILVGKQHVRALSLSDGSPAWPEQGVAFPTGSKPSGTGYLSGNVYFVPLTSAEVMAIDLAEGKVASLSRSRRGSVPGNLVCHRGMVISQRADALEVFYQLDALKNLIDQRLAGSPRDAAALSLRGEILWHQGRLDDAIAAFRQSLQLADDSGTRDLLRDAYFNGLETDFARHRAEIAQIEPLVETPCHRATFLRLLAAGMEKAGEFHAALENYGRLIELDRSNRSIDAMDKAYSIRRDRWIQSRLTALRETGPAAVRTEVDQLARAQWQAAQQKGTSEALSQYLDYFGNHPLADEAREQLVRHLRASGRLLQAELLLRRQERSSDRSRAAAAVAELAEMLHAAGRPRDAAACYARLEREFGDVPDAQGKTGKQRVAELAADHPARQWLEPMRWPTAAIDVTRGSTPAASPTGYIPFGLEYTGLRRPFFSDVSVELHPQPAQLVARDGLGQLLWQMNMTEIVGQDRFALSRGLMRLSVEGHLMLLSIGDKLLAVDTLGGAGGKSPQILWRQDLEAGGNDASNRMAQMRVRMANLAGGIRRLQFAGNGEVPIHAPEAISEEIICLRQNFRCVGVDPATGEIVWQRQDIPPEASVFGDHQYIFIAPLGESKAQVLRAADGELLGQREIPADRLATVGRHVLVWRDDGSQGVLEMIDAWTGRPVWPARKFPAAAQVRLVDDEAVALFDPEGRFLLLNLADGAVSIDARLQPGSPLSEVFVLRSPEQQLVITQGPEDDRHDENRHTHPIPGAASQRITRAQVYAFDRHGKSLWKAPREVKDQFLPLEQPRSLPVLVFASMIQERKAERRVMETSTALLAIDKRSGQVVCDEKVVNGSNGLTLVGNPEKKTVQMRLQRETVTLTFSDESPTTSGALWKAIRRAVLPSGQPVRLELPPLPMGGLRPQKEE